jgi:hypothetical protein
MASAVAADPAAAAAAAAATATAAAADDDAADDDGDELTFIGYTSELQVRGSVDDPRRHRRAPC